MKYREVVFLQIDYFDSWWNIYDNEGLIKSAEYLYQWDSLDENQPLTDKEPWGQSDEIWEFVDKGTTYVLSYNYNLMYVSLTEVVYE